LLAGPKKNLLLAKAEPISDGGNSSVTTYLKRGKNCCATVTGREE